MEEQELAERCRQGDNLARKELYERYAGRMLSVCLRYAGDRCLPAIVPYSTYIFLKRNPIRRLLDYWELMKNPLPRS